MEWRELITSLLLFATGIVAITAGVYTWLVTESFYFWRRIHRTPLFYTFFGAFLVAVGAFSLWTGASMLFD